MPWTAWNAPSRLTTRTGSVPSTQVISIVPGATSVAAPTSNWRINVRAPRAGRCSRGRRVLVAALRPLRLQEPPEPLALGLERDACHDWLQEAERDELAGLVRRDPAALKVEQLGRIDRPHAAGMRCPLAVRLVDLQRRDRHRAALPVQDHPELAQEAVRSAGRLLDPDETLDVGTAALLEDRLAEQVPGRVLAHVTGVRGEVEELVGAAEDDLHLLDGAPLPHQPVVDPRPHDPRAELRQGKLERGAATERRGALVEKRGGQWQVLDRGCLLYTS